MAIVFEMARARNIKPGFFRNAELVELPFETRLLFPGLWIIADKAGRLEDRPKQIKMDLFPADNLDVDAMLSQLEGAGLISRYEINGKRYIQVVNFCKHQNPHKDERASTIPEQGKLIDLDASQETHRASTVQAQGDEHSTSEVVGLIADSLIPYSLIPDPLQETVSQDSISKAGKPAKMNFLEHLQGLGVEKSVAEDFLNLRKAKRAALTMTALDGITREAVKAGLSLDAVLREMCARGWQGFKADWMTQQPRASPARESLTETRARTIATLTGQIRKDDRPYNERDITAESKRIA